MNRLLHTQRETVRNSTGVYIGNICCKYANILILPLSRQTIQVQVGGIAQLRERKECYPSEIYSTALSFHCHNINNMPLNSRP